MSHSLESDDRGIILPCPACGTANRIAYPKVSQQGRCGSCKADLPHIAAPVADHPPPAPPETRTAAPRGHPHARNPAATPDHPDTHKTADGRPS